ncbi:MAG: hypothetical protein O2973_13395 [Gemmatimonadetes bacterium]|nr:hypothetical protein [Gemmatimonadota bacterium]
MSRAPRLERTLFWSPRILAILFALSLVLFSLDVFSEDLGVGASIGAFLIHLTPFYVVLLLLWLSWWHERAGALAFVLLAGAHVVLTWGRSDFSAYAVIAGPAVLIAVLFFVHATWVSAHGDHPVGPQSDSQSDMPATAG